MSKSFIFILIPTIFFQIIISENINNKPFYLEWQSEFLKEECKNVNQVFCPMIPAIADIFTQIQKEEIEADSKDICIDLCLTYSNIHVRDMICETLDTKFVINLGEVIFGNCSVLISGEIGYENKDYKNINFGTFLSELYIPSMTFSHVAKLEKIEFKYENASTKFNYDNTRAVFKSMNDDLNEQMEYILNKVYDEFIFKIEDKLNPILSRNEILSDTNKKIYNSFTFYENGPNLFDEKKNLTYLSFFKIDYTEKIILREKIIFYNLQVDFQYALNYNITYNDGLFVLKYVDFEANEGINNIYYPESIQNMSKQSKYDNLKIEIWELIINEFKKKFNEYKVSNNNNVKKSKFFY